MKLKRTEKNLPLFTMALMAAGVLSNTAVAQVQKAGDLFIDLDATKLAEGPVSTIPNNGTLGGVFEGGEGAVPVIATEGGTKGIRFDGGDYLQALTAAGGSFIPAPGGLVGESPTRSIEVWVLNPEVAGEETLVSWGHRGGPDGSNLSFNYGSDFRWGAVGHWGGDGPDLGWNNNGGNPEPNKWHHLVYTFDGAVTRVYSDGQLMNFETVAEAIINTYADTPILIGSQIEPDGLTPTGALRGSLTIGRVRVHDGVLTPAQITTNYNLEKAEFINPGSVAPPTVEPARLAAGPIHRYSFSEAANTNATDLEFRDSIGTSHGKVLGDGAEFTGSRLRLAGGLSESAAYGDLPNGLVSSEGVANGGTGLITVETWFKHTGSRGWSRVFDFGSTTTEDGLGELTGPGIGGNGLDYFMLAAQTGDNTATRRLEVSNNDPAGGGNVLSDIGTATFNTDTHLVVTWNEATGAVELYENGVRVGGVVTDDKMSDMNDVNIWLGRSNWTADQNLQGEFDEVRIYDRVLTPGEVRGNYLAGPNIINDRDVPVTIVTQPANVSVPATLPATFRIVAEGSTPLTLQWLRNGVPIPGATEPTYTLPSVTSADTGASFTVEVTSTIGGTPTKVTSNPAVLTVVSDPVSLAHRYSFNEASGTQATDSVGNANGTLQGSAVLSNGELLLDGSEGTYVDLPNGLITGLGANGTFEMWITYNVGPNWSRIFDFGISNEGEDLTGGGLDFIFLTTKTPQGFPRFEANFPDQGGTTFLVPSSGALLGGVQQHIVITYSSAGNIARFFIDGQLVGSAAAPIPLSNMNGQDKNVWLGRSQFNDPFFNGKFNEFRLYKGAMTPEQVAASFAAGPNELPSTAPTPSIGVQLTAGGLVVTWPESATGFRLEESSVLGSGAAWTTVGDGTPASGGQFRVTVPINQTAKFLRLVR